MRRTPKRNAARREFNLIGLPPLKEVSWRHEQAERHTRVDAAR
jgi:hypothetical protein